MKDHELVWVLPRGTGYHKISMRAHGMTRCGRNINSGMYAVGMLKTVGQAEAMGRTLCKFCAS